MERKLWCPQCKKERDAREGSRSKASSGYDNVHWECTKCGAYLGVTMEKKKGWFG